MDFLLIVKLIVLGIGLLSALSYMGTRSSHKASLKQTLSDEPIRQLTSEEFELLRPYLEDKKLVRPYSYQSELVNHNVYLLQGECTRHSFSTNGAESSYYFEIANVEVFFPYRMEDFTIDHNVAEVVFTKKYAFILSLNSISIFEAKTEQDTSIERVQQWQQGERGQYKTLTEDDLIDRDQDEVTDFAFVKKVATSRCEIVQQRDESEVEKRMHNRNNTGFLSALFLIISVILVLFFIDEGPNENNTIFLILGSLSALLSLFFYSKKSKLVEEKINQVKGTLIAKDSVGSQIIIGDSLQVNYPDYWDESIPDSSASDVDIDVSVSSHQLVRFGHTLSVAREIETYGAPRFWGRNCLLAVTGLVLFFIVWGFSTSLKNNLIYTYSILTNNTAPVIITDRTQLQQQTLAVGNWVDAKAIGQCDVDDLYNCNTIKVHHKTIGPIDDSMFTTPDWVYKASQNKLVNIVQDSQTQLYEMLANGMGMYGSSAYNNRYNTYNRVSYSKVKNISSLVPVIHNLCQDSSSGHSCSTLKSVVFELLNSESDDESSDSQSYSDWNALAEAMQDNPMPIDVVVNTSEANKLSNLFKQLSNRYLINVEQRYFKLVKGYQQESDVTIQVIADKMSPHVILPGLTSKEIRNWNDTTKLTYYMDIVADQANKSFRLKGMVTDVEQDEFGMNVNMTVDANFCSEKENGLFAPAIISTFLSAMLALFTAIQLMVWMSKVWLNKRRIARIKKELHKSIY